MKPAYERDRSLEDKFARVIKCVLGLQFFGRTEWADTREGTDFAIFSSTPVRVAVRLRRQKFYEKYPDDVTIRWSRPSGIDTEADKINKGMVGYLFYGFIDEREEKIISYRILELQVPLPSPVAIRKNNPPDSELAVFKASQFNTVKHWKKT